MIVSKIEHNTEPRIKVVFKSTYESIKAIREIPGSTWSKSHNAWMYPIINRPLNY